MTAVEHLLKKHFGSQQALADLVGVQQSAVAGWHKRNSIPHRQQRAIIEAAKLVGVSVMPKDFFPNESEAA